MKWLLTPPLKDGMFGSSPLRVINGLSLFKAVVTMTTQDLDDELNILITNSQDGVIRLACR